MGFFSGVARRAHPGGAAGPRRHTGGGRTRLDDVPPAFVAVGEALVSGLDPCTACDVVGRELAKDGADLGEALLGLRATWLATVGQDPDFASTQATCTAWSEATLGYLHQLSCEDPLTGLASTAHIRARIAEVYRESECHGRDVADSYALVVIDSVWGARSVAPGLAAGYGRPSEGSCRGSAGDLQHQGFVLALELSRLAETIRSVFSGGETMARVARSRLVVLVRRGEPLGRQVAVLRRMIDDTAAPGQAGTTGVWIEGLPERESLAARLLDELSRE